MKLLGFLKLRSEEDVTPSVRLLWGLAAACWVAGAATEFLMPESGGFSSFGGVAIAATTPVFGGLLAKMSEYSTWIAPKVIHASSQVKMATDLKIGDGWNDPNLIEAKSKAEDQHNSLEQARQSVDRGFRRLLSSQIWIVSSSSLIWATGDWWVSLLGLVL